MQTAIKKRNITKFKLACREMIKSNTDESTITTICADAAAWFKENVTKTLEALRQITNTLNKKGFIPQLANIFFELAKKKDTCESDENRNVMKYIFDMVAKHPNFREMWIAFLKRNALKIEDPYLSAWIMAQELERRAQRMGSISQRVDDPL